MIREELATGDLMSLLEIAYWRRRKIALGNSGAWEEVIERYRENNPHLPLAVLAASGLGEEQIKIIHRRLRMASENGCETIGK